MTMKQSLVIVLLSFFSLSCDTSTTSVVAGSPEITQPLVTGIYITSGRGPEPVAVWGNPSDTYINLASSAIPAERSSFPGETSIESVQPSSNIPHGISFPVPYPNPTDGSQIFQFSIPIESHVSAWIVPARSSVEPNTDIGSYSGATTLTPVRTAAMVFFDRTMQAGTYQYRYDPFSLPGGFYRIYVKVNDVLAWHDILYYKNINDLPVSLRSIVY